MGTLSPDLVRRELERILASPEFARAPRHRRFITFIVEETLAGRADELKEYVIGVSVFDKGEQFDPKSDSTVRTEATKLRARLDRCYSAAGPQPALRILMPKGS